MSIGDRKDQTGGKSSPPDDLVKTGAISKVELTEDELQKVTGGVLDHKDKDQ